MLIGNYSVLNKTCGRFSTGPSVADNRSNYGTNGSARNRFIGWAGHYPQSGTPDGYGVNGFIPPVKAGGMATGTRVSGAGSMAGAGALGKNAEAMLSGAGDLDAVGQLIVSMLAAITGSGTISGADLRAFLNAVAALSGSGDLDGLLGAKANVSAALSGDGDLAAIIRATGQLAAEISVAGGALSTTNVGDAVWAHLIEAGFDAARILRIIAAATAGASSGGPDAPVFRDLSDTEDMVSGDADAQGDRANVTYGGA